MCPFYLKSKENWSIIRTFFCFYKTQVSQHYNAWKIKLNAQKPVILAYDVISSIRVCIYKTSFLFLCVINEQSIKNFKLFRF